MGDGSWACQSLTPSQLSKQRVVVTVGARVTSSAATSDVATRSGTNAFHGTAYEFNCVSDFASNTFDNNANGIAAAA